jgi:hypothetical protein
LPAAGQIEKLAVGAFEEIEELAGLAAFGAEVNVGDPNRAILCRNGIVFHSRPH